MKIGSPEAAANGKAALARTTRCIYCNATSTKESRTSPAGPWCHTHRPGPRKKSSATADRLGERPATGKRPPPPRSAGQIIGFREGMLGKILPHQMLTWPPCARIIAAKSPGQRVDCGLRHVAIALVREAMGPGHWSRCLELLEKHGYLLPGDPPLPHLDPDDWSTSVADALIN